MMLYIYTKSRENNLRVSDFLADVICILKFAKGHNSVKSIDGVMLLELSISSDKALYWYRSTSLTCTRRVSRRVHTSVQTKL